MVISGVAVAGLTVPLTGGTLTLDHNRNDLAFTFCVPDYTEPSKNRFAYQLTHVDRDWIYTSNRNYARYPVLPPGEYVFRVRGQNSAGVWSRNEATFMFHITPPFWTAWWFILAMALLVATGGTAAYRYRITKLLEIERMRLRIASDLHDELGSSLSAIGMSSLLLQRSEALTAAGRDRLHAIGAQARNAADAMREIVWFVRPEHDSMEDLTLKMKDVALSILGDIPVDFTIDAGTEQRTPGLEFRRAVFLAFKEILTNIVRHAGASRISVSLHLHGGEFEMAVTDNGVGFDTDATWKGNGLRNLTTRAAGLHGRVDIQSAPDRGTTVHFYARMT